MTTHPLKLLMMNYLAEKDITPRSYDLYLIILNQYTEYLIEHQIIYATTIDVLNYLQWKRNQGYSTKWMYNQTSIIRGFYHYLSLNQKRLSLPKAYAIDITESLKNERICKKISKPILTIEQAKQLILYTMNNRKYIWQFRDHAMLYLMITTGIRSVEMRRAKRKDLRKLGNQLILDIQGKGRRSKDEFVKISEGVEKAIDDYLKKRKDKDPYLFISYSHRTEVLNLSRTFFNVMIKRVLKDAGLKDTGITAHALRHSAATFNLLRGGSLESTRQFMRHKNMSTTLIYAHHLERMKDETENLVESYILGEDDSENK